MITIDRKNKTAWDGVLHTRFVLLTNELPRLRDTSGALASRFVALRFTRSFYDKEDNELGRKLNEELPGILNWAIEGWRRLNNQGRFTQTTESRGTINELADIGSPVHAFVHQRCVTGPEKCVSTTELYGAYRQWCLEEGRQHIMEVREFGRQLRAVVPELKKSRSRQGRARTHVYTGVTLADTYKANI